MRLSRHLLSPLLAPALALGSLSDAAHAEEPVELSLAYTADVVSTVSGGADSKARYLDNLDVIADSDLEGLLGWSGARAHVHVLNNLGAKPNDSAGTLQGVNNIEVANEAVRLFEAWVEQSIGESSLLVGLYDLNGEFYATDSAGLLIAPPFGIGSELAASGPNGPSIFPSTALAARLAIKLPGEDSYLRLAAINAHASTLGDDSGVDFSFHEGLLLIGEAGTALGKAHVAAGAWTYTRRREDLFHSDVLGDPLRQRSWGAYGGIELPLVEGEQRKLIAFLRGGFSEGHTTPYAFGTQAGFLLEPGLARRPDSALSLGFNYARTNADFHEMIAFGGDDPAGSEYGFELTYSDKIAPWLTLQPDLQIIANPGGLAGRDPAIVAGLRVTFEWPSGD